MNICSVLNLFFAIESCLEPPDTISTNYGDVVGYVITDGANDVLGFEGVPYAQPLTIKDRFQKGKAPTPWVKPLEVRGLKPACYNLQKESRISRFSEDCLYLNIYKPMNSNDSSYLPVLVFLSSEMQTSDVNNRKLALRLAKQDIILVTVQYRTRALGFLAVPGSDIPMNIGLWDQHLALQFIHDNIKSFGGDSQQLTLMGHGFGSISTSAQAISPASKGMIQKTIQFSGSIWDDGPKSQKFMVDSQQFLEVLNCSDIELTLGCLKNISLDTLIPLSQKFEFGPILGDEFLPFDPHDLVSNSDNVPCLISTTEYDYESTEFLEINSHLLENITENFIMDYIMYEIAYQYGNYSEEAAREIFRNYFDPDNVSSTELIDKYLQLLTDITLTVPVARELKDRTREAICYIMHWNYTSPNQFPPNFPLNGSYYGQELAYLLNDYTLSVFSMTSEDIEMQNLLLNILASFVKTGNPSINESEWLPYNVNASYLVFQIHPENGEDFFEDQLLFWNEMNKYGKDIFTGQATQISVDKPERSSTTCIVVNTLLISLLILWIIS